MIYINERITSKVPGDTSLFISFNNLNPDVFQDVLSTIRNCEVANFSKKTKEWEVTLTDLAYLLDSLPYFDDININLLDVKESQAQPLELMHNYKTKPYPYQEEGILYGINHKKWLLLDAPGLGKTLQIIYIAEELKQQKNIEHCFIICGLASLKSNWKKEIERHSKLDCRILGEKVGKRGGISYASVAERAEELMQPIKEFFIITNIETLRSNDVIVALNHSPNKFDMIAIDEVHKAKSKNSQQGKNMLKLNPEYLIAATGTLLLNSPIDCYVPLHLVDKDRSTLTNFKQYYSDDSGQVIRYKHMDLLKETIQSCSLRRTKELLKDSLPEKVIIDEFVDMNDAQAKFYKDIVKGIVDDVDKVDIDNHGSLLALVTRLRQATACPSILTSSNIISSKVERCVDLVNQLVEQGEKVLIFSTFKETVNVLKEELKEFKPLIGTGDIDPQTISNNVDKFQTDPNCKVFICTHQKLGTGQTLNAASYAIFIDTPWTAGDFNQACDRIHRIGSRKDKTVFIYNLICKDTFDERVNELIKQKDAISDFMIDNVITNNTYDVLKKFIMNLK